MVGRRTSPGEAANLPHGVVAHLSASFNPQQSYAFTPMYSDNENVPYTYIHPYDDDIRIKLAG